MATKENLQHKVYKVLKHYRQGWCNPCIQKHLQCGKSSVAPITASFVLFPEHFERVTGLCAGGCARIKKLTRQVVKTHRIIGVTVD